MESPTPNMKSVAKMIAILKHNGAYNRKAINDLIVICQNSLATTHKWNYLKRKQLNQKIIVLNFLLDEKKQPVSDSDPVE
ncbi:MAG: hypothetical protein AAF688_12165 [Bacteroidota bacterium]